MVELSAEAMAAATSGRTALRGAALPGGLVLFAKGWSALTDDKHRPARIAPEVAEALIEHQLIEKVWEGAMQEWAITARGAAALELLEAADRQGVS